MTDLAFEFEDLWYIRLINAEDKNPLDTWGGYSQDFESTEHVYSHAEVVESAHENWGVVGVKGDYRYLLIFDLDVYKAPEDFDKDSVTIPKDTPVVESQSGGKHVYYIVDADGAGRESEFTMQYDLGWDVDIRGSYVKHHVVAPNDIPGVGGLYTVENDAPLRTVFDANDAAENIRYLDPESDKPYGEPLLQHSPVGGFGGHVDIDRDVEPPDEMPTCYHRGLQIRNENPDDPNVNTHKINTLTALCGLASGYSIEEMIGHFCDEYPPGPNGDRDETEYQLTQMARKMDQGNLAPPKVTTLRNYGILGEDEVCGCPIGYHDASVLEMEYTTEIEDVNAALEYVSAADVARDDATPLVECDALQAVALEEGLVPDAFTRPKGKAFFRALEALIDRGANVPRLVSEDEYEALEKNTATDGGLDEETILTLSGPLSLRSTRKRFTYECPGCGAAVTDDHSDDCDLNSVAMMKIHQAYQTVIDLLDNQNRNLSTLRAEASGWSPVHTRVVEHLHDGGAIAPAGREVVA